MNLEVYGKPLGIDGWDNLMKNIFTYAEDSLKEGSYLVLDLPLELKLLLPKTSLIEETPFYWYSHPRGKMLKDAKIMYRWKKA